MRRRIFVIGILIVFLQASAVAESFKYGPYPNYKGYQMVPGHVVIPTISEVTVVDPFGNTYKFGGGGGGEYQVNIPVPVFTASYLEFETSEEVPFNPKTDPVILTEVWAVDRDPQLDPKLVPPLWGFNQDPPNPPEMLPAGSAFFRGLSGMTYPVSLEMIPAGALAGRLPGYDISKFSSSPPNRMVYVQQAGLPGSDFVYPSQFEFSYEYLGYVTKDDPEWVGPYNSQYPYQHSWVLNISQWNVAVPKVSDVEVEAPIIIPGYVEIIPPENWIVGPWEIGRYGYDANPNAEFTNVGTYTGWKVNGKTPYVVPGYAYLTNQGSQVSVSVPTMVVGQGFEFNYEYQGCVTKGDPEWVGPYNPQYPYQHSWVLNISQWDSAETAVTDVEVELPSIIPGYVEIVPPENWIGGPWTFGRYGYDANPGSEFTNVGTYTGWKVNGKMPYVVPGYAYLTNQGSQVSVSMPTMVVGQDVDFEFEYVGSIPAGDPDWRGEVNPAYPFQHIWRLNILNWGDMKYISDIDIDEPWVIKPGYIEVVPPENWHSEGVIVGRYGYEANEGSEISVGGGSLGIDWRVNGKVPYIVPGHVTLTYKQLPVSRVKQTMIVAPGPACGDWGYAKGDINRDCYVNIHDFVEMASEWLSCTDPMGGGGGGAGGGCGVYGPSIVGVGFAFNGDSDKPAQVFYLYDYSNAGTIRPNDVIVNYRGMPVSSGEQLLSLIQSMPALTVGEPVPMTVIRDGLATPIEATAGKILGVEVEEIPCDGSHCAAVQISGGGSLQDGYVCQCVELVPKYKLCVAIMVREVNPDGKTVSILSACADSGGNSCAAIASGG